MSTPIPFKTGDVLEFRVIQSQNGQTLLNSFHYRATVSGGPLDFKTEAPLIMAYLKSSSGVAGSLNEIQDPTCTQAALDLQIIHPTRYVIYSETGNGAGLYPSSTISPPQNVGLSITTRGTLAGQGYAGGVRLGGMPQEFFLDGEIAEEGVSNLQNFCEVLKAVATPTTGVVLNPIIWSVLAPESSQEIWQAFPQSTVRVYRRRTVRLGI